MPKPLILIPTEFEAELMRPALQGVLVPGTVETRICGFGPIASGIRTTQLLVELKPSSCVLVGIAGTYQTSLTIGSAYDFSEVACYGIGAGSGSEFKSASEMGWPQWPAKINEKATGDGDIVQLSSSIASAQRLQLVTVCAASASEQDVTQRLRLHPDAAAEDMEGFSVALACLSASIPLTIIRGISNRAGDRDRSRWAIEPAIEAAAKQVIRFLRSSAKGSL